MIQTKEEYEITLIQYEELYSRFNDLTPEERNRLFKLESDIIMYENSIYQKN